MKKILLTSIVIFCFVSLTACSPSESGNDNVSKAAVADSSMGNETKAKNSIDAFGVVKSSDTETIFIDFPAVIKEIHVEEGEHVKKDDKIFTLDMKEFEDLKLSKEREFNIAKLELESAKREISKENNDVIKKEQEFRLIKEALANENYEYNENVSAEIKRLLNDRKYAKNSYDVSLNELESKGELLKSGVLSNQEVEDFKKSVEEKEKALRDIEFSIESSKDALKKEIDSIKESKSQKELNVKIQQERVAGIESEIETLTSKVNQTNLKDGSIITEVNEGIVYEIVPSKGENISGRINIASVVDTEQMFVLADISEEFIKDIKVGADVTIKPLADELKEYKGKVTKVLNKAVVSSGQTSIRVEISIENKDDFLFPDMNVDVEIEIS